MTKQQLPKIGIGVIIINEKSQVLIGKRTGSHAPYYSIPGGHLEFGETFEATAIREIKEETNLMLKSPEVIAVTNNLETFRQEGKHYVSILLLAKEFEGELKIMEPDNCESWQWVNPKNLPEPHFDASKRGIECFLKGKFYKQYE